MSKTVNIWPKKITVDKRIVKILSEQTYENFPNAIKELITNSYDADSTKVELILNHSSETIEILDNGWGMSENEFNFYLRIAGHKREKNNITSSGRLIIGQFGVGFLSVFPFFKTFTIETKKKSSKEVTFATIPCYKYFSGDRVLDVTDINIQGGVRYDNENINESYTKITLSGFTEICKNFFYPSHNLKNRKNSIHALSSIEKLKWKLCEDLPLPYKNQIFQSFSSHYSPNLPFSVFFNKEQLFRSVYGEIILDQSKSFAEIGGIKFQYFIVTNKQSVTPNESRYLKIRNLNAGVGERTNFGLGTAVGGSRSRLHWLTGEVLIVEGINDIITVSRDGFNFSPDYEKLKEFFIKKLTALSNQLEKEAEYKDFVEQSTEETKIKNLRYLNPKVITKTVSKFNKAAPKSTVKAEPAKADNPKNTFEKKIKVRGKTYKVQLDSWDFKTDFFPAVKIKQNVLLINNKYPLFGGKKYTDIFIKMHLLLLLNFEDGEFKRASYTKMTGEIMKLYQDYLK
jgi:hypothetical protein